MLTHSLDLSNNRKAEDFGDTQLTDAVRASARLELLSLLTRENGVAGH